MCVCASASCEGWIWFDEGGWGWLGAGSKSCSWKLEPDARERNGFLESRSKDVLNLLHLFSGSKRVVEVSLHMHKCCYRGPLSCGVSYSDAQWISMGKKDTLFCCLSFFQGNPHPRKNEKRKQATGDSPQHPLQGNSLWVEKVLSYIHQPGNMGLSFFRGPLFGLFQGETKRKMRGGVP